MQVLAVCDKKIQQLQRSVICHYGRTSWVKLSREALRRSAPIVEAFSELEGLDAHGRSVAIRLAPKPNRKSKQANASIKTTKPETNR